MDIPMDQNSLAPDITVEHSAATASGQHSGPLPEADRVLDITAEVCPMTFVRTRLALDRMSPGQTLLVLLRGDEPRARVPATAAQLGHAVVHVDERSDGTTRVLIRRA